MPTGMYERPKVIPGAFKPGIIPHNKGIQLDSVLSKVKRYRLGLPIKCKHHGEHSRWILHSINNVRCKICISERQKRDRINNPIKMLLRYAKARKIGYDIDEQYVLDMIKD